MQVRTLCSTVSYATMFSRENSPQSFVFPNESSGLKTVDCLHIELQSSAWESWDWDSPLLYEFLSWLSFHFLVQLAFSNEFGTVSFKVKNIFRHFLSCE